MGVMIAVAFVAVAVLSMQLRTELRALQQEPVDSLQWNVTQLELDVVRLEAAATLALAQPETDLADLRKRYDLFFSRAGTVRQGTMFARLGLSDTVRPLTARMQRFLDSTTPLIDSPDENLRAALPQVVASVGALRQDMRTMAIHVIDVNAAQQDARRAKLSDILRMTAIASFALIALLMALLALALGLNSQAVRRSREVQRVTSRLAATVGTSLDAVVVAGMDGRVIDFNDAAERIFGYARAEAIGQPLGTLIVPPRHQAAHDAGMTRIKATGVKHVVDAGRIQITAVRKSGEEFPVELSIASNEGPDGIIFIAYLRDISDAQKAEAALVAARDEAQAAERTKTNFIAVMSHEMRTPLNGVIAALEIIGRTTLDAKQDRFLGLARSSAKQLLHHVNDVLDISRIDAGFMAVADDRFDLPALIATLIDPLRPTATQRNTQLDVRLLSDFPRLQGDPFRLGQILQNFVMNAIKFTKAGSITIEAEVHGITGDQADIEFRVTDTGIGITDADQARIFEDFVMVDPSFGRSGEGTGLGLAISRRLARAMEGEIGVESSWGEGSCFWLRLPLTVAGDIAIDRPAPVAEPMSAPASKLVPALARMPLPAPPLVIPAARALDILVVEDNATNRIVMEEMLLHLGHRVTLAVDGIKGVNQARARRYDVILMDLSMPLMDGWTATAAIRADGASQVSRIIAVTAHAHPDRMDRFADSEFDSWLTKPLSTRALSAALLPDPAPRTPVEDAGMKGSALPPLVDTDRLAELTAITDPQSLQRLLGRFRSDMENTIAAMTAGSGTLPLAALATICHEGASAAAVIGASRLHYHLARMEAACRDNDRTFMQASLGESHEIWSNTWASLAVTAWNCR
jgi:PAS domain S-box-containing protein